MKCVVVVATITAAFLAETSIRAAPVDATIARRFELQALQAYANTDVAGFLAGMSTAVALRPDHPRLLYHLAIAQTVNAQPDAAVAMLGRLADLGVFLPAEADDEFAPLRKRDDFRAVLARLAANRLPVGTGEVAFSLPEVTGLIEGIAWREKTGDYFFGDVHERCVWVRHTDGSVQRFTPASDERLLGVFGLGVDEARGVLWAAMSAVPEMRGFTDEMKGAVGLAAIDLTTGDLRRVIVRAPALGEDHVIGDLALAPDGAVFATDSAAPILWRLAPDGVVLESWLESDEFLSLQGIAFTADARSILLAAYGNGLLRVDLAMKQVHRIVAPPSGTLLGCDGLVRADDGTLIAVQNGVSPTRVLRLTLDATQTVVMKLQVLEAAHPTMADATLGCLAGSDFVFIGDGGWNRFDHKSGTPVAPRVVPILHTH